MMETEIISETSVYFSYTTWHYIPEDSILNIRSRADVKSHIRLLYGEVDLPL
jgi:hypothetical protein